MSNVFELLFLLINSFNDLDLARVLLVPAQPPVFQLLPLFDFFDGVVRAAAVVHVVHITDFLFLNYRQNLKVVPLSQLAADILNILNFFREVK